MRIGNKYNLLPFYVQKYYYYVIIILEIYL